MALAPTPAAVAGEDQGKQVPKTPPKKMAVPKKVKVFPKEEAVIPKVAPGSSNDRPPMGRLSKQLPPEELEKEKENDEMEEVEVEEEEWHPQELQALDLDIVYLDQSVNWESYVLDGTGYLLVNDVNLQAPPREGKQDYWQWIGYPFLLREHHRARTTPLQSDQYYLAGGRERAHPPAAYTLAWYETATKPGRHVYLEPGWHVEPLSGGGYTLFCLANEENYKGRVKGMKQ